MEPNKLETVVLGGGCFWCLDAVYSRTKGIKSVTSGYAGGDDPYPDYEKVCSGVTGHAEVVEVKFDPEQINYEDILNIFFLIHDPTSLNKQGNDIGNQYRSIILYANEDQKSLAEKTIKKFEKTRVFEKKIITEIKPLENFYKAEEYHQDYFAKNPEKSYCQYIIAPKLNKFREKYRKFYQ